MTPDQSVEPNANQPAGSPVAQPPKLSTARRRWLWRGGVVLAGIVLLLVGYLVGHNGKSELRQSLAKARSQRDTAQAKLADAQAALSATQTQLSAARGSLATARAQAQHAMQTAQAKVQAQYAGKLAHVDAEQQQLTSEEKTVKTEEGQLDATAISLSGVYVVGQDIKSGTWHTNGDGGNGLTSDACYFATLNSSNTEDIADNNNFDGAETVNIAGAYAFEINGPCAWYYVG
jgi:F0F1-type ATP synthase membrane subunit b/b'